MTFSVALQAVESPTGPSKRTDLVDCVHYYKEAMLEAFYFSFGENDFCILVDLPDNVTTAAVTFSGNVSGTFSIKGVPLLTPEEMDAVVRKSVDFRPPGHQQLVGLGQGRPTQGEQIDRLCSSVSMLSAGPDRRRRVCP